MCTGSGKARNVSLLNDVLYSGNGLLFCSWLHNLCWYDCCLDKQPPETLWTTGEGASMMEWWLRRTHTRVDARMSTAAVMWRSPSFSRAIKTSSTFPLFFCLSMSTFFVVRWIFLGALGWREKIPSNLTHEAKSMWKAQSDVEGEENFARRKKFMALHCAVNAMKYPKIDYSF